MHDGEELPDTSGNNVNTRANLPPPLLQGGAGRFTGIRNSPGQNYLTARGQFAGAGNLGSVVFSEDGETISIFPFSHCITAA
jgi:hypothetical protein